jgi:hypothetical protein
LVAHGAALPFPANKWKSTLFGWDGGPYCGIQKQAFHQGTPIVMTPSRDIAALLDIMAKLRTPVTGWPGGSPIYIFRPTLPKKKPPGGGCHRDDQSVN